jgi:hypothetical protein
VDDAVARLRRRRERFRLGKIADHRLHAPHRDALRLFSIAHEGRHLVAAAQRRIENG